MTYTTWNYAPPNSDGTCPNPDTHMLITSNAPGSCFVDGYPPYTCIQPDPLNEANTFGFNKQTNKDYAICAPSCSSPTDCPPVGADPRSGKNLQGQPNCTFMPNMTEYTVKGHCVITPPIFTQTDPRIPNQHYDECELIGGDESYKTLCDTRAHWLHRSPADNFLHINDPATCEQQYTNFLNTNPWGQTVKSFLQDDNTRYSRWLLNPSNWCSVDPVFPKGTVVDGAVSSVTAGALGKCDVKQGTLPSSCKDVDCNSRSLEFNELECRNTNKDCCQWYLHQDPKQIINFGTGYFPINKPTPPSPPPPSVEKFKC